MFIERRPTGDVLLDLRTPDEVKAIAAALFENWIACETIGRKMPNDTIDTIVRLENCIQKTRILLPQVVEVSRDNVGQGYRAIRDYANGTDEAIGWLASPSSVQSKTAIERMELGDTASSMAKIMLGELGDLIFPVVPVQER